MAKLIDQNQLSKDTVITKIDAIIEEYEYRLKRSKSPQSKRQYTSALEFYKSIKQHLQPCKTCSKDRVWYTAEVSTEAAKKHAAYLLKDWKANIKHFDTMLGDFLTAIELGHKTYLKEVGNG